MIRKSFATGAVALALALAGCSGSSDNQQSQQPVALVSLATAHEGNVSSTQMVYGAVEQNADTQYTLSAPVEAVVARIAAAPGSPVRKGQLVVSLSPSPSTRANIDQLKASATNAELSYKRAKRLQADGLASNAAVEAARSAAATAKANLAAARAKSKGLALRSPGSGFVQSIPVNPGDLVSSGTTVATINRTGALRARFGIAPQFLSQLSRKAGLKLQPLGDGPPVTVPIIAVDPSADTNTRLASIYVKVPQSVGAGAGQPLSGSVTLRHSSRAVTVPYKALLNDGGQPYVFVVSKGVAHRKDVTVGASNDTTAAVLKGVSAGEKVVTQGGTALEDGMKVRTK